MVAVIIMMMTCIVAQVPVCDGPMYCQTKNLKAKFIFPQFAATIVRPEIPSSLLDDLVHNGVDTRSNPQHISENNPLDDADGNATATTAAEPTTTSDGALLKLCGNQLKNDFEYQCFKDGVRMLGAQLLRPVEGDIGP